MGGRMQDSDFMESMQRGTRIHPSTKTELDEAQSNKQYLLFAGSYPQLPSGETRLGQFGGWNEYKGKYASEEEVFAYLAGLSFEYDWWQVVDLETKEIVAKGLKP